jgi:uncharacterized membrane protein
MFDHFIHQYSPFIAHGVLSFFGAVVHASKSYRDGHTKTILDFLALVIMSSFSGVMFALLGLEIFGVNSYLTMAMAGTGGFIGVEGMTFVVSYLTNKFK